MSIPASPSRGHTQDWYELPAWYDILHAPGTAAELDALERIFREFVPGARSGRAATTWLEPACGSGRLLRLAAARGRRVIGFDRSSAMVDYARRRLQRFGPRANVFVAELDAFRLPIRSADFAFCPINTLRHLPTDAALARHLRLIGTVLRPGGVYAVGMSLTSYGRERPSRDVWEGARGNCRVRQVVSYAPPSRSHRRELVTSRLTIRTPLGRRRIRTDYWLRSYSPRQWQDLIARAGMRVVGITDDAGRSLPGGWSDAASEGYAFFVLSPAPVTGTMS